MSTFCESPCLIANVPTICQTRHCIIRQSARGNYVATELLFERVYAAAYRQAQRICHGDSKAEDLAEETLVLAFAGLAHLKNPQLLLHWMSKLAWNRHRARLRTQSNFVCRPDHSGGQLVLRETAQTLVRAMKTLPPVLCETFRLRVLEQLSTRDTAARLGTTEMAISARLGRARRRLRDSLERSGASAA